MQEVMKEFINGSDRQYQRLKEEIQDGTRCRVYEGCQLPACCNKSICKIGVEKERMAYKLLIETGITCSKNTNEIELIQFKQLLSEGEMIFLDFNDLKVFLKSLDFLY